MTPLEIVKRALAYEWPCDADADCPGCLCASEAGAILAALRAAGWVVVPREATDAMLTAGRGVRWGSIGTGTDTGAIWRAMVAAAEQGQ